MANLPSNTFLFNYNAKEYNPSTQTLPKTAGQLFDEDIIFTGTPYSYNEDSVTFGSSQAHFTKVYNNSSENPFNVNASNHCFTFIYKTSGWNRKNIMSNGINDAFNYLIKGNSCIFATEYCNFSALNNPQYVAITLDSNGIMVRNELDINGNVIQSDSVIPTYRDDASVIEFFPYYGLKDDDASINIFYWMYMSRETLTDDEILQVIQYNEKLESDSKINSVSVEYKNNLSTSLNNKNEISTTTSVTPLKTINNGSKATNNSLTVSRSGDNTIKIDNLYCNGSKIKQMILNKEIVHRNLEDISE